MTMIKNSYIAILNQQGFFNSSTKMAQYCEGDTSQSLYAQLELIENKIRAFKNALPSVQEQLEAAEKQLDDTDNKDVAEMNKLRATMDKLDEHIDILIKFEADRKTELSTALNEYEKVRQLWLSKILNHLKNNPKEICKREKDVGTLMQVLHLSIFAINLLYEKQEMIMKQIYEDLLAFSSNPHIPDDIFFQAPGFSSASHYGPEDRLEGQLDYDPPGSQLAGQSIGSLAIHPTDHTTQLSAPTATPPVQSVIHHPKPFIPNFRHISPPPGFTLAHHAPTKNFGLVPERTALTP